MAFEEIYAPTPDDPNADSMFVGAGKINRNLGKTFEIDPNTGETVTPVLLGQEMDANGRDIVNAPNLATTAQTTWGDNRVMFGLEYLLAYLNNVSSGTIGSIGLVGDSLTKGTYIGNVDLQWPTIFSDYVVGSFPTASITNYGVDGATTYQWANNLNPNPLGNLSTQLAANPRLWIIGWGTNDANYQLPPTNLTFDQAVDQYRVALNQGLAAIRADGNGATACIVLRVPLAGNNGGYLNSQWNEAINPIVREAAREYGCLLFDAFGEWNDAQANGFLQDGVHPYAGWSYQYAAMLFGMLFPPPSWQRAFLQGVAHVSSRLLVAQSTDDGVYQIQCGGSIKLGGNILITLDNASLSIPVGAMGFGVFSGVNQRMRILNSGIVIGGPNSVQIGSVQGAGATLDFPSISAGGEQTLTVPVTGLANDNIPSVSVGWRDPLPAGIVVKQVWVSGVGTVSITLANISGSPIDPPPIDCRVTVATFY